VLRRLAGHRALDFVNTIDPREGPDGVEYFGSFSDVVGWAFRARVLTRAELHRTTAATAADPVGAAAAFGRAIDLREASYAVFAAVATRRPAPTSALARLETAYRQALAHSGLVRRGGRFEWEPGTGLDLVRWRIAQEAVALLESDDLRRVKRCPGNGDCGWLFLDRSKNATRRWCSMTGCGNRAKLRRFLTRHRRASP
jgi:predicted RNA-binding Zn ribbon-like protein